MRGSATILGGLIGACLAASGAQAAVTAYADTGPTSATLTIPLYASINGSCGFGTGQAPNASVNVAGMDAQFSQDIPFAVACNTPVRVAVVSAHQGMLAPGTPAAGFTNLRDYTVGLTLAGDAASNSGSCAASTLGANGSCAWRGPSSNSRGLLLSGASHDASGSKITISASAYAGASQLVDATYADTLTVTMTAAP